MVKKNKIYMILVLLWAVTFVMSGCSSTNSPIVDNSPVSEFNVLVHEPGANFEEDLNYFKLADTEVSLAGKTTNTDESGVARFNNIKSGSQTLTISKAGYEDFSQNIDVTKNALPAKINIIQVNSAKLQPNIREFNPANPENINTSIEWNGSNNVEGLYRILSDDGFDTKNLLDSNLTTFNKANSTLIIDKQYFLNYEKGDKVEIFISFDQGSDSLLTINIVENEIEEDAEINPSKFDFNIDDQKDIETIITWNKASEVDYIESEIDDDYYDVDINNDYILNEETNSLVITADEIMSNNPKVSHVLKYTIHFDVGNPAELFVTIIGDGQEADNGDDEDEEDDDDQNDDDDEDTEEPEEPEDGDITITGTFDFQHNLPESIVTGSSVSSENEEVWQADILTKNEKNELIIRFRTGLSESEANEKVKKHGYEPIDFMPELNAMLVKLPQENIASEEVNLFSNDPEVLSISENSQLEILDYRNPNDTYYDRQWSNPVMRLPQTWRDNTGSSRVRIAILDTGIDHTHPDLLDNLNVTESYNAVNNNDDAMDYHSHGTHVAGIVGAVGNNARGVAGVMWDVEMLPVKVMGDDGSGSSWDVARGILYSAGLMQNRPIKPVDVINMSLGSPSYNSTIHDAVKKAHNEGVLIVAAAGNSGTRGVSYPAKYDEVIAVGALELRSNEIRLAHYSSYGPEIDVVAPGSQIISTIPNSSLQYKSGTSMAAPQVAGLAGLMIADRIPHSRVRDILRDTAIDMSDEGFNEEYGHGLVNSYWATNEALQVNVMVGTRNGSRFDSVAQTTVSITDNQFKIEDVPAGEYEVITWLDVRSNNTIENGDYYSSTGTINLNNNPYDFDFTLKEYNQN